MIRDREKAATKLAAALLLLDGQISVADIAAFPFVDEEAMALAVARKLMESFDTYTTQRQVLATDSSAPIVEDVIVLNGFREGIVPAPMCVAARASSKRTTKLSPERKHC